MWVHQYWTTTDCKDNYLPCSTATTHDTIAVRHIRCQGHHQWCVNHKVQPLFHKAITSGVWIASSNLFHKAIIDGMWITWSNLCFTKLPPMVCEPHGPTSVSQSYYQWCVNHKVQPVSQSHHQWCVNHKVQPVSQSHQHWCVNHKVQPVSQSHHQWCVSHTGCTFHPWLNGWDLIQREQGRWATGQCWRHSGVRRILTACTESMIRTFCNMEDVYWQTQAIIYKQDQG